METPYVIERVFDAPAIHVWKAITEAEVMRQWFFDLPDFSPKVGFVFRFEALGACTQARVHLCEVTEVVVGKRLAYTWRYEGFEGDSLVTFEIMEEGVRKTRLRLTHAGLETFPFNKPGSPLERKDFAGGWNYYIGAALYEFLGNIPDKFLC